MSDLSASSVDGHRRLNRLSGETSPYLLQHQHNPVDWYPWGPEAFERARREDKAIFLSVGYSTCYWCHVMERQCFEIEGVAAVMNEKFVNIKVDREERPDVDQLYMTAVQLLTRHGGWPMSVWLTPDLKPFYGGTYFPPTDQHGRPGFVSILHGLDDAYRNRRADVAQTADQIFNVLRRVAEPGAPDRPVRIDDAFIDDLIERSTSDYDPTHGGFGGAPKFPRETLLELILVYLRDVPDDPAASSPKSKFHRMIFHTLDALAAGGIRDHLGGGFHRYSTDAEWLVPHFEIMLYDNAMLAWCYVEAYRQTGEPRYAAVARGVFDFVLREMTSPAGAFYTALDAEVDGQEGLNYLWTAEEIESRLGDDDARLFNSVYGVDRGPNFADPHHGSGIPENNILYLPEPLESVAKALGTSVDQLEKRIEPMRQKLKAARNMRKQPLLDTKVLTSWNALMIRALAYGGQNLSESRYVDAAAKALGFLLEHHQTAAGGLYRTSRDGRKQYDGFLDDYASLIHAMLALKDAGAKGDWQALSSRLADAMSERFGDPAGGFYFTDERSTDLIVRQKTATDSPLPSGNAVATMALLSLGQADAARATIVAFAQQLQHNGEGMSSMVQAAMLYLRQTGEPFTVPAKAERSPTKVERPQPPGEVAKDVVRLRAEWAGATELHAKLSIAEGFHLNAHGPGAGGDVPLVPTGLSVRGRAIVEAIEYPPGEERRLAIVETPVRVYDGDVTIVIRFKDPPASKVHVSVTYQACDESACLPVMTKSIEVGGD